MKNFRSVGLVILSIICLNANVSLANTITHPNCKIYSPELNENASFSVLNKGLQKKGFILSRIPGRHTIGISLATEFIGVSDIDHHLCQAKLVFKYVLDLIAAKEDIPQLKWPDGKISGKSREYGALSAGKKARYSDGSTICAASSYDTDEDDWGQFEPLPEDIMFQEIVDILPKCKKIKR